MTLCHFKNKMIPLILKLKKEEYKRIALAQDMIIEELYNIFNKAVLHGGTSIWRCYQGNRFSEDIDVYIQKENEKINRFFKNLQKKGFVILKKKISENSLYSNLQLDRTFVKFEALFRKIKGSLKEYATSDGNLVTVYTLTPEELIKEKIDTYVKRRKIRDLYDIFFLLRYVKEKNEISNKIKIFLKNFQNPIDEEELKVLIFDGLVPKTEEILNYIKRFE